MGIENIAQQTNRMIMGRLWHGRAPRQCNHYPKYLDAVIPLSEEENHRTMLDGRGNQTVREQIRKIKTLSLLESLGAL